MDTVDLFADFDENASSPRAGGDTIVQQIEYHRDQLLYWRQMKARLEESLPKSPIEELLDVAKEAWNE